MKHVRRVLSSDISECTDLLEKDMPDERVLLIAARMEADRRLLERIDHETLAHPEWE